MPSMSRRPIELENDTTYDAKFMDDSDERRESKKAMVLTWQLHLNPAGFFAGSDHEAVDTGTDQRIDLLDIMESCNSDLVKVSLLAD